MEEARQHPALTRRALLRGAAAIPALFSAGCWRATDAVASQPQGANRLTLQGVRAGGPEEWHRYALFGNWDFDDGTFGWIAKQPQCDRATALVIFWKSEPDYYLDFERRADVPEVNRTGYDLVTLARDSWVAGRYVHAEFAFDLAQDYGPVDFAALDRRYGARLARLIPSSMRQSLPGRRLTQEGREYPGVLGEG